MIPTNRTQSTPARRDLRCESTIGNRQSAMASFVIRYSPFFILWAVALANAQSGGGYDLTWSTIDSGGHMFSMSMNGYELGGTIGQADAGVLTGTGGYTLQGGFWPAATSAPGPGCGPCLLFADFVNQATPGPYGPGANCIVDSAEVSKVLDGYAAGDLACTNPLLVDTELSFLDGCPPTCSSDADCPSEAGYPGVCTTLGTCCALVEAADLTRTLDAYAYVFACPAKCSAGACAFNTDADPAYECCKDRDYFPNGMSRAECSAQGGTYLGDDVFCSSAALPYCP